MKTKDEFSSETCEDKTTRIFLCFAFCSALCLCLDYDLMLMLMTILMSQAWLDPLCFALMLMLMLSCEPGLNCNINEVCCVGRAEIKVGVLPIRIAQSNVSSIGPSSEKKKKKKKSSSLWRRANARNVRLCYPYWQYTDLFVFRF